MSELLIRPSHNDHVAMADLLVPADSALVGSVRRPISRLVLDAPLALGYPQYREAAAESGTSLIIDPLTTLLQVATDPAIGWAKLPYARNDAIAADLIANQFLLRKLVERCIEYQVQHGASAIVAPYFYARSGEDPAFVATLEAMRLTARELHTQHVRLPLIVVLCASHRGFARRETYGQGVDRFAQAALNLGPQMIALCLSPNGAGDESPAKVLQLITTAQRLKSTGVNIIAWRQGFYGPALVAAGLDGYETGTGVQERSDIPAYANTRKPGCRDGDGGFSHTPVYVEALGRSIANRAARALVENSRYLHSQLVCRDVRCCPQGVTSMLGDGRRQHNVRTRARQLRDLDQMPHAAWRLNQIAKNAYAGGLMATKINEVLAEVGEKGKLATRGYESLGRVAEQLGRTAPHAA
jgi:hypothetical protein